MAGKHDLKKENSGILAKLMSDSSGVRQSRAELVAEELVADQKLIVANLEGEKRAAVKEIRSLTDLYPESTFSLNVVKDDFNGKDMLRRLQDAKIRHANKTIELELANHTLSWLEGTKEDVV